jgi:hypothetical protein
MLAELPQVVQLNWLTMKKIEPRLATLERRAAAYRGFRSQEFWHTYEALKSELRRFVGWHAAHPMLSTSDAYQIAISVILGQLESRRNKAVSATRSSRRAVA